MDSRLLLSSNARELPTAGTRCALAKHTLVMLKKIAKQKLRSPFWSVLEVLTPLIFVTLVTIIWSVSEVTTIAASAPLPLEAVQEMEILAALLAAWNMKIVFVPDTPAVQELVAGLTSRYPGFNSTRATLGAEATDASLNVPPLSSVVSVMADSAALETYVRDINYATPSMPAVYAAIDLSSSSAGVWDYVLRMNSTASNGDFGPPAPSILLPQSTGNVNVRERRASQANLDHYLKTDPTELLWNYRNPKYAEQTTCPTCSPLLTVYMPGFLSLQLALNRFIINTTTLDPLPTAAPLLEAWSATFLNSVSSVYVGIGPEGVVPFSPWGETMAFNQYSGASITGDGSVAAALAEITAAPVGFNLAAFESEATSFMQSRRYAPQGVSITSFPAEGFSISIFYSAVEQVFGLFFVLSFFLPVFRFIKGVVAEKEQGQAELLATMGAAPGALLVSWTIVYTAEFFLAAVGVTLITCWTVFAHTNALFVLALFALFGAATTCFCYMVTTLFSRALVGALFGALAYVGSALPTFLVITSVWGQTLVCLLSPCALSQGLSTMAAFEATDAGITWVNVFQEVDGFAFSTAIWMLAIDCVLYSVIGWYLERVMPRSFGVRLHPLFCVKPSFWCPRRYAIADQVRTAAEKEMGETSPLAAAIAKSYTDEIAGDEALASKFEEPTLEERQLGDEQRCVRVDKLRKVFSTPDGPKVAVNDLDAQMYESQIFVLLGHNGAGKTTTISMLSGLTAPSGGGASVFGLSVDRSMDAIRQRLGVCPQKNVLFDDLTVRDHLVMFAALKNVPSSEVAAMIDEVVKDVGLTAKINELPRNLSGGQKRKACLAIAMMGNNTFLVLDEPTSGMDVFAQRSTWNLLQRVKRGKIVILTTHSMDEADILGDKIGIMADGKMVCCGSPLFLKQRYGAGYSIVLTRPDGASSSGVAAPGTAALEDLVKRHVPEATVVSDIGKEISFSAPLSSAPAFEGLFAQFDDCIASTRGDGDGAELEAYGISVTTMEEVFLKSASENERVIARQISTSKAGGGDGVSAADVDALDDEVETTLEEEAPALPQGVSGGRAKCIWLQHFAALFIKRVRFAIRDWKAAALQILVPLVALGIGLAVIKFNVAADNPSLALDASSQFNVAAGTGTVIPFSATPIAASVTLAAQLRGGAEGAQSVGDIAWNPIGDCTAMVGPTVSRIACNASKPSEFNPSNAAGITAAQIGMDQYLLDHRVDRKESTYGAFELGAGTDVANNNWQLNIWQNSTAAHGAPIISQLIADALLRTAGGSETASITAKLHPLPLTLTQTTQTAQTSTFTSALIIVMAFAFIPVSFATFIVRERQLEVKHQQLISGVSITAYWTSTFLFDVVSYIIPCAGSIIMILAFQISGWTEVETFAALCFLFILYGISVAPFTYILSYFLKSPAGAMTVIVGMNLIIVILIIACFVMSIIKETCQYSNGLKYLFLLFPPFALGDGLVRLSSLDSLPQLDQLCKSYHDENYVFEFGVSYSALDFNVVGPHLIYMTCCAVVYFLIAVLIDVGLSYPAIRRLVCRGPWLNPDVIDSPETAELAEIDDDVAAEEERLRQGDESAMVRVLGLRKVYAKRDARNRRTKFSAVKDLWFSIPRGEVFGFLGVNGAGKSTTLKMLSGDVLPTRGTAQMGGLDILNQQVAVRRLLGYCPQTNALLPLLSVREHLSLFARIKGVPWGEVNAVVERRIQQLDLVEFRNKLAGTLSGGNKRKLCVAIALIGEPPVIFLDEPSAGMDPVAKRFMWNLIASLSGNKSGESACTVILTTHSMEECTALCSRIGIMVDGGMRCLGTEQHLKNKFGKGLQAQFTLADTSEDQVNKLCSALAASALLTAVGGTSLLSSVRSSAKRSLSTASPSGAGRTESVGMVVAAESGVLRKASIEAACALLAMESGEDGAGLGAMRAAKLLGDDAENESGWIIAQQLAGAGFVTPEALVFWWCTEDRIDHLDEFMRAEFDGCALIETHGGSCRYFLPPTARTLGQIFGVLEGNKTSVAVSEYALSQTTLEQIFLGFAARQQDEKAHAKGIRAMSSNTPTLLEQRQS